ncbi:hypothetical protein CTI14_46790, partial [Methylobacterium radiotolerans]
RYPAQAHDEGVRTPWDHLSFPEAIAVVEAEIQGRLQTRLQEGDHLTASKLSRSEAYRTRTGRK